MSDEIEPAAPEVAAAQPQAEPPKFVGGKVRSIVVPLEWPLEYDGTTYTEIRVRRMTGSEVAAFVGGDDDQRLPMVEAPRAVIDALDADDAMAVNKAITDFLPRSLRADE